MDRAVKLAIDLQNKSLAAAGMTSATGRARRLGGRADAGERLGRGGDEADQVAGRERDHRRDGLGRDDPDGAVGDDPRRRSCTLSPTASAPQISTIKDNGLPLAAVPVRHAAGQGARAGRARRVRRRATLNVGARNDAFGTALSSVRHGSTSSSAARSARPSLEPDQANFDTEAGQLVSGNPAGWVIIDFPETFQKFAPSLVRTGKWDASEDVHDRGAAERATCSTRSAARSSGCAAPRRAPPAGRRASAFAALWKKHVKGAKPYTGFEGTRFDAANVAFLAAVQGLLGLAREDQDEPHPVSGPPGMKVTFQQLATGDQAAPRRQGDRLRGRVQPGRLRQERRHRLGRVRDLEVLRQRARSRR